MESFARLRRLHDDQCVPPETETPDKIELEEMPLSSSLQSPSDPDVTCGHIPTERRFPRVSISASSNRRATTAATGAHANAPRRPRPSGLAVAFRGVLPPASVLDDSRLPDTVARDQTSAPRPPGQARRCPRMGSARTGAGWTSRSSVTSGLARGTPR
jgi:hypothetical protein